MQLMTPLLLTLLLTTSIFAEEWTPPSNVSPLEVLQQAKLDTAAKEYPTALAKLTWFHEHALQTSEGYRVIRLSIAMSHWHQLADNYPPAKEKIMEFRDAAKAKALKNEKPYNDFAELEAINSEFGETVNTVATFLEIRDQSLEKATTIYPLAQAALITAKKYDVCSQFLNANSADEIIKTWKLRESDTSASYTTRVRNAEVGRRKFLADSTLLVSLLAINDRHDEAVQAAAKFHSALDDESFHKSLEFALKGRVPPAE